jgi:putative aldouronate transport system substrate-binding protein
MLCSRHIHPNLQSGVQKTGERKMKKTIVPFKRSLAKPKRWFALLAFALILSQLLAACAPAVQPTAEPVQTEAAPVQPAATDKPAPTQAPTETEAPPPTPEPTTPPEPVDIAIWANATVTEAGAPPDDWIAYDIIREKLGINLTYVIMPTGADGEAMLNAAAAANDLPDFFQMVAANNDVRGVLFRLVELGLVAPVDDLMPLMPERVKTHYSDPLLISLVTFDGKQYGFPEPPPLPRREGFVIRKDWLDKLSLQPPTTLDELFDVAVAFTEQDPDGNGQKDTFGFGGFVNGPGIGTRFDFIFGAFGVPGVWNFNDPANFGLNVRNPNYPQALAYMSKLVEAKVIDPDWPTLSRDDFRARWKQGQFGIMWEDFAALTNKSNYTPFDENFPEGEWVALPAPKGPDGQAYYGVYTGRGNIFGISTKAADDGKGEAIARLLEWMATPEGYYLLGFGQEGVNFKLDADGNVITEGIDPEKAWNSQQMQPFTQLRNQLIFYNTPAEIIARYPSYQTKNGRTMEPMTILSFFQAQPWVDGRGVQVILPPANAADFDRYYNEGLIQFALGQKEVNDANWAEFLAGLDSLGAVDYEAAARQSLEAAGLLK